MTALLSFRPRSVVLHFKYNACHSHQQNTPSSNMSTDLVRTSASIDDPEQSSMDSTVLPRRPDSEDDEDLPIAFHLTLHHHNRPISIPFLSPTSTLQDLSDAVAEDLHVPARHQKFLITPKTGLLKYPFPPHEAERAIKPWADAGKKIVLLGATTAEVEDIATDMTDRQARMDRRRAALREGRKVHAARSRDVDRVRDEARYTFHSLAPLQGLPHPEKSLRFLERLRDDAGIRRSMRTHGFAVGLLTEMDPAEHTTHESRTLGLNRNRGEVIELRLRTDAYDGYRDYRVIRNTLCHELAHNVWGPHDRNFWDLCHEIEKEVERNDWRSGGHSVGREEFYNPADEGVGDEEADGGGWEGGEYVLGGRQSGDGAATLSRREIMARAAEDRAKKLENAKRESEGRPSSPSNH